jgi:hypothetical protein
MRDKLTTRQRRPGSSGPIAWLVGIAAPLAAGALSWLTGGITTTAHACATGAGGSTTSVLVFIALVALAPGMVLAATWRWKLRPDHAVPAAITATVLALIAVFLGDSLWWSAHNCMT